jgi:primosomal protein N' (replication factor Y)
VLVATVVPDVTGLDKEFDYLVADDDVVVGTIVRVDLHGRRIGGWVRGVSDASPDRPIHSLKPITKVTGHGPGQDILELADWAAVRWASRRIRPFLVAASPTRAVPRLPSDRRTGRAPLPQSPATRRLIEAGGGVLRLAPRVDVMPSILAAAAAGPCIVVVPERDASLLLATRIRRSGLSVASLPEDWAAAAGGVDVVIGTRTAVWAPCTGLASIVVIDEHDEALQEQRTPTWHVRDVAAERARRCGAALVLVSPVPTLVAVEDYAPTGVVHPPPARERAGWPRIVVVDRTDEDPWKRSIVTSALIDRLRDPAKRVVCVSNITGRARVLACRTCRALVRCEQCDAAVGMDDDGSLGCRRCGSIRPPVCRQCGAGRFANLRPGVARLREELEAAAARPVVAVTGRDTDFPAHAEVYVGTEAVLHRVRTADVVAFVEFDSELLAPRFRATEHALALLVRAGRVAPEVLVQTFSPDHAVLAAASVGDPGRLVADERERRRRFGLPPFGALAAISGAGADAFVGELRRDDDTLTIGADGRGTTLVRGTDWASLGEALNRPTRPVGAKLRIEVDPPRV